jgi:hypothetical protein
MYHRLRNPFGHTRWHSKVTRVNRKLVLVCLEITQILTQDRCTICAKCTIGSEIVLDALLGDEAQVIARFGVIGDSANLDGR